MSTVAEAERIALRLSDSERARLAEKLIASLPSPFVNDDDGIEESVRRSREMDEDPNMALTYEEFMASFKKYRRQ